MRVAIVCREQNASFSMDVYAEGLIYGLRSVRPQWEIIKLQPQSTHHSNAILKGVQKYYQRYWQYPRTVRAQTVNLIHVIDHSDGHLAYWLKQSPQPTVFTCHDLINFAQPENISDQARLSFLSTQVWRYAVKGLRYADRIISVSDYTAKDVNRLLGVPLKDLTVVPDAVEAEFHPISPSEQALTRQQYQIPAEAFCLLNVGSNHPRKNIFTILKVLHQLHQRGVPAHFLKVGANFTAAQRAFIDQNQLSPWIIYAGKPDKRALVRLYGAANVLVAPSLYEGFGMTILESMACGTPVVASDTSSLPEAAGDAALLVDPKDVDAITTAIHSLRKDNILRETLIKRGLKRVQDFTWENTAEQIARVYESALQNSKEDMA